MEDNKREKDLQFVDDLLYRKFLAIGMCSIDAGLFAEDLREDVLEDVYESADNVNSEDVSIAMVRVMKRRFCMKI